MPPPHREGPPWLPDLRDDIHSDCPPMAFPILHTTTVYTIICDNATVYSCKHGISSRRPTDLPVRMSECPRIPPPVGVCRIH